MSMKITGGTAAGIPLETPRGRKVRPTGARAKEALFNSLTASGTLTPETTVVDIFAGTGGLGLEAASRGAKKVFLVEKSSLHCRLAEKNAEKMRKAGVLSDIKIINTDALFVHMKLREISGEADIIFADPPYAEFAFFFGKLLNDSGFCDWAQGALMIWECPPDTGMPTPTPPWRTAALKKFGGTNFLLITQCS